MEANMILMVPQIQEEYSASVVRPLVVKIVEMGGYKSGSCIGLFEEGSTYPEFVISKNNMILISKQIESFEQFQKQG